MELHCEPTPRKGTESPRYCQMQFYEAGELILKQFELITLLVSSDVIQSESILETSLRLALQAQISTKRTVAHDVQ